MLWFATRNLLTRPLRSVLAFCGLTVAIMGMVGLFSVAEGIDATVNSTFERIPGVILMQPGTHIPLLSRLPSSWKSEIEALPGVHVVNAEVWARANVIEGKPTVSPPRFLFGATLPAVDAMYRSVYREALVEGRFLTSSDAGTERCVVSRYIAEEFEKQVGDTITVDGHELEIIGIYHTGSLLLDVSILLDAGKTREIGRVPPEIVSSYYVEPDKGVTRDELIPRIKSLFRGRAAAPWFTPTRRDGTVANPLEDGMRGLFGGLLGGAKRKAGASTPGAVTAGAATGDERGTMETAAGDGAGGTGGNKAGRRRRDMGLDPDAMPVDVRTSDEYAAEFKKLSADLDLFLLIMTSIGVVIAVLGIVNTMLMSVTERFIDFGILKANGWSNQAVLTLITLESAILGFGGGLVGSLIGWGGTELINVRWPERIHLFASPQLLLFSVLFSTVVGVLGGLYPAWWASRMSPMEAIRRG